MSQTLAFISAHRKLIVAAVGAAVLIVGAVAGESSTLYTTIVSVATALGVYAAPNSVNYPPA